MQHNRQVQYHHRLSGLWESSGPFWMGTVDCWEYEYIIWTQFQRSQHLIVRIWRWRTYMSSSRWIWGFRSPAATIRGRIRVSGTLGCRGW